jgi:drug/metabolite transporter (DMT)-like permease
LGPGLAIGLAFAFEFVTLFFAVKLTTVTNAIVFFYTAPFFVALGSITLLPNERLRPRQWLGMGLAFLGVAAGFRHSTGSGTLVGDVLAVVAGAGWAATTLLAKATGLRAVDPLKTLLYQTIVSAVVCASLAFALGEPWPAHLTALPVASVLYQAVWVTALTYPVWFWLLTVYRAAELSAFTFLAPVLGVVAGWLLLGEVLTPSFLVAMALVALGILLVNWPASGFRSPADARGARRDPA